MLHLFSADGQIANPDILFYLPVIQNVRGDAIISCLYTFCDETERLNQSIDRTYKPWTRNVALVLAFVKGDQVNRSAAVHRLSQYAFVFVSLADNL
jgi:hypothetical protein